jgi:hypothetical protein
LENLHTEFNKYPKLKCAKKLFGDRNTLRVARVGTIFEDCKTVQLIVNLRNELIHNSSWETRPRLFSRVENGEAKEKFILTPDTTYGNIDKVKNRNRFFSSDNL